MTLPVVVCGFIVAAFALSGGCTNVQVPGGSVTQLEGRYVVLGVVNREERVNVTGEALAASRGFPVLRNFTVPLPPGTQAVVPTLTGWALGYGEGQDPVEAERDSPDLVWQRRTDANFGLAQVDVTVTRIFRANETARQPLPEAAIQVTLRLHDYWGDQPWWGVARYQLMFLGCAHGGPPPC